MRFGMKRTRVVNHKPQVGLKGAGFDTDAPRRFDGSAEYPEGAVLAGAVAPRTPHDGVRGVEQNPAPPGPGRERPEGDSMHPRCTGSFLAPSQPSFRCVRRLGGNELGPEGGMALAEALKSNTTLKTLQSAAQPSNPLTHA